MYVGVMKITGYTPLRPGSASSAKARKGTSSSSGFSDLLTDADSETGLFGVRAPETPAPVSSMSALLSLQEMPDEEVRKKKAMLHGTATLEALEKLRDALLMGTISESVLRNIGNLLAEKRQQISDPRLIEIMDEIELRAAVELAKFERQE